MTQSCPGGSLRPIFFPVSAFTSDFSFLDLCFSTRTAFRNTAEKVAKTGLCLQALLVKSKEGLPVLSTQSCMPGEYFVWQPEPGALQNPQLEDPWKRELCSPQSHGDQNPAHAPNSPSGDKSSLIIFLSPS